MAYTRHPQHCITGEMCRSIHLQSDRMNAIVVTGTELSDFIERIVHSGKSGNVIDRCSKNIAYK